jgi:hypothetical protein
VDDVAKQDEVVALCAEVDFAQVSLDIVILLGDFEPRGPAS